MKNITFRALLGIAIRAERRHQRIRQADAAETLGISQSHYSKMERGLTSVEAGRLVQLFGHGEVSRRVFARARYWARLLEAAKFVVIYGNTSDPTLPIERVEELVEVLEAAD